MIFIPQKEWYNTIQHIYRHLQRTSKNTKQHQEAGLVDTVIIKFNILTSAQSVGKLQSYPVTELKPVNNVNSASSNNKKKQLLRTKRRECL